MVVHGKDLVDAGPVGVARLEAVRAAGAADQLLPFELVGREADQAQLPLADRPKTYCEGLLPDLGFVACTR